MLFNKPKVAIVLGGGGARGVAHLGILEALEEANIPINMVAGASIGALIGALYAKDGNARSTTKICLEYLNSDRFSKGGFAMALQATRKEKRHMLDQIAITIQRGISYSIITRRPGLYKSDKIREPIEALIPDHDFESLKIPFATCAIDLLSGQSAWLSTGSLRKAIEASMSLPGFFPPVLHENGMLLVDPGAIHSVPVELAHYMGADFIIAVDISYPIDRVDELKTGIEALFRIESISSNKLNRYQIREADVVIKPELGNIHWADFSATEPLVNYGRAAAQKIIPALRKQLLYQRFKFWHPKRKNSSK